MTTDLAAKRQWWDFFAAGGRHDIPLSQGAVVDERNESQTAIRVVSASAGSPIEVIGSVALNSIASQASGFVDSWYLGDNPAPTVGFTKHGLHLPTIPLIRWEDVAAIIHGNMRGARDRATNKDLIPDPGVGSVRDTPVDSLLLIRNADQVRPTIDPRFADVLIAETTASGARWGTVVLRNDPAMGPEQLVEFAFLLDVLGTPHGMETHQTGGFFVGLRNVETEKRIHQRY